MPGKRLYFTCARLCFAAVVLMTSVYCLLAFIPFTRRWVVECPIVSWLPAFVKFHPLLYWAAFGALAPTIVGDVRRRETRRLAACFFIVHAGVGVWLLFNPLLPDLPFDARSFIWGVLALFPLWWLSAIDYAARIKELGGAVADEESLTLSTALLAGSCVSALYFGVFCLRYVVNGTARFKPSEILVALTWSAVSHLSIFGALFVAFRLIRLFSRGRSHPLRTEFLLCNLAAGLFLTLVIRKVVLSALSFNSRDADIFSAALSFTVVAFLSGLSLRLDKDRSGAVGSGLGVLLSALAPRRTASRGARAAWLALVAVLAYAVPANIVTMDWNGSIQKLSVTLVWTLAFATLYAWQGRGEKKRYSALSLLLIAALCAGGLKLLGLARPGSTQFAGVAGSELGATIQRYTGYDISTQLAGEIAAPKLDDDAFHDFLKQNTNIPASAETAPPEVNLVDTLTPAPGGKPNIFIFVVDSLRQDYVSPYNRDVTFTPNVESFARESVVLESAFTRYGGTVLSEASIWVGGMLVHKEFSQPFYPMNSLQKLIDAEGYESFITVDPVLRKMLRLSPSVVELDVSRHWYHYDLADTLRELRGKLDERRDSSRPVFFYTQAQNLHAAARNPQKVAESFDADGLNVPYAATVERIDALFGDFIRDLKARGLYDNSVVILTSDHGESFGEAGRWGHVQIFPEILRIPLIIHLPEGLQKSLNYDPKAIAFSTDITPSLYYLLGHRPTARNHVLGRPLFTATEAERADYFQESYLVASSYTPTYGILSHDGRSLFIAEGGNAEDHFFDLAHDPKGLLNRFTPQLREKNEKLIRERILQINQFYKFERK